LGIVLLHPLLHRSGEAMARQHENGKACSDLGRFEFAFSLPRGYEFAVSRSCNAGERFPGF
jgi:hypothetical protein